MFNLFFFLTFFFGNCRHLMLLAMSTKVYTDFLYYDHILKEYKKPGFNIFQEFRVKQNKTFSAQNFV